MRRMMAKMITDAMKSTATVCPERERTNFNMALPRRANCGTRQAVAKYHKPGEATGHGPDRSLCAFRRRCGAVDPGERDLFGAAGGRVSGAGPGGGRGRAGVGVPRPRACAVSGAGGGPVEA